MLTLPSLMNDPHTRLVACAAPRQESRQAFAQKFGGRAFASVELLAADPDVEAIYIATPHGMHREHAEIAAAAGKHILVEKPVAISLADAVAITDAAERSGVHLITGPGHSFDPPVLLARDLIVSGKYGAVKMIHAFNYTDFLYRPRRPEELDTREGGGVMFSQAIHQVDIIRLLMGCAAERVYGMTGAWDSARPTEGAYSAIIAFAGGRFANLTYSGYAHFDSDCLQGWIGELGHEKNPGAYGSNRKKLATMQTADDEARLKREKTFGATDIPVPASCAEHFGPVIVSCEAADLRLTPKGVEIWGNTEKNFIPAPPDPAPRSPVLGSLYQAIRNNNPPPQSGAWGTASLEICLAIMESSKIGKPVILHYN